MASSDPSDAADGLAAMKALAYITFYVLMTNEVVGDENAGVLGLSNVVSTSAREMDFLDRKLFETVVTNAAEETGITLTAKDLANVEVLSASLTSSVQWLENEFVVMGVDTSPMVDIALMREKVNTFNLVVQDHVRNETHAFVAGSIPAGVYEERTTGATLSQAFATSERLVVGIESELTAFPTPSPTLLTSEADGELGALNTTLIAVGVFVWLLLLMLCFAFCIRRYFKKRKSDRNFHTIPLALPYNSDTYSQETTLSLPISALGVNPENEGDTFLAQASDLGGSLIFKPPSFTHVDPSLARSGLYSQSTSFQDTSMAGGWLGGDPNGPNVDSDTEPLPSAMV